VTGPPGAGKTTALADLARQHPGLARFGVRDYGLRLAERGDPLGLELRDQLLRNELLSDEAVLREFHHFIARLGHHVRWVAVEGYPRNLAQCGDLLKEVAAEGHRIPAFVVVEVPDAVARRRTATRRMCARCGQPSRRTTGVACATCGGSVVARSDDAPTRFARRLADYRRCSAELRAYFARCHRLEVIDGLRSPAEVRALVEALLLAGG
jgi:adenylate kinase